MHRTLFLFAVAVAVFLCGQTGRSLGYVLEGQKWPNGFITMNLQLSSATYAIPNGQLMDGNTSWNDVAQAALDEWNEYLVNVQFNSNRNVFTAKSGDRLNTVFFASRAFGQSFGSDALAVTVRYTSGGTNTEADVVVNSALLWDSYRGPLDYVYYYDDYIYDLRRVLDHEFGHVLGLNHPDLANPPQYVDAVMNSVVSDLDHIAADDINGAEALYGNKPILASLNASATPAIGGTVSGGGNFRVGTTQQLVATPAAGYTFYEWQDGNVNPARSVVVPVGGATYQATFQPSLGTWFTRYSFSYLNNLIFAKNEFFVFGSDQLGTTTIITSPDGTTWTQHPMLNFNLYGVAYGNGVFATIVGSNVYTSTDGVTWTVTPNPNVGGDGVTVFGNGVFVCVGDSGITYTSSDGINWTKSTYNLAGYWLRSLTFGNGKFVAVGQVGSTDFSLVSTDGVNWTSTNMGQLTSNGSGLSDIMFGDGLFLATSPIANFIYYSTDGVNWTGATYPGAGTYQGEVESISYGNGTYLAAADYETLTSTDGINWIVNSGNMPYGQQAVFGHNTFVSIGSYQIIQSGVILPVGSQTAQTISFGSLGAQTYGVAPITLGATATSSLPVTYSVVSGPAAIAGNQLTVNGVGTVVVAADQGGSASFLSAPEVTQSFTVNPASVTITANSVDKTVGQAINFTGTEFSTTGLQNGETLFLANLASSGASALAAAGSYPIVVTGVGGGTFNPANYTITYANGTLSVGAPKTIAKVTVTNLTVGYDGSAHAVSVTTNPVGLAVNVTYAGSTTAPSAVGTYAIVATVNDANYSGSGKGSLIITKGTATVTLGDLAATYDNNPHAVSVTTSPVPLATTVTYKGSTVVPSAAGSYAVVASVTDANYIGSKTGTLVIGKGNATVTLGSLSATYDGKAHPATASTSFPGLLVNFTYNGKATPPVAAGAYTVIGTASSPNAQGVSPPGMLTISPASASVSVVNKTAVFTGKPITTTANTTPAKLAITFTYDGGSTTAPVIVGDHSVVATISNPNYIGTGNGTISITPIPPVIATGVAVPQSRAAIGVAVVNPKGATAQVYFDWGLTATYDHSTAPQSAGSGIANINSTQSLNPLTPSTPYHYRAVAIYNNGSSKVFGADKVFTTLSEPVFALSGPTPLRSATGAQVSFGFTSALAGTAYFEYGTNSNLDLSPLTTPAVSFAAGKSQINISAFLSGLTPSTQYYYRLVVVTAAGTFRATTVELFFAMNYTVIPLVKTGQIAEDTGGATFATVGSGAVNASDGIAFAGTLALNKALGITALNDAGIWAEDSGGQRDIVVQLNDAAFDVAGAVFTGLGEPVYNDTFAVAFQAQAKTGKTVTSGIWSDVSGDPQPHLVASVGGAAPGGSTFSAIGAVALADTQVLISGTLNLSAIDGITKANNIGIWEGTRASDLALKLRTGDTADSEVIATLVPSANVPFVAGQTRNFASNSGDLLYPATFKDGKSGFVKVVGSTKSVPVKTGDSAIGIAGATFTKLGSPIIDKLDQFAFTATVAGSGVTVANNVGIWADDNTDTRQLIARTGGAVPGVSGAVYLTLSDPVYNSRPSVGYQATYKSGASVVTGLFMKNFGATPFLVAATGAPAPGCDTNVVFSKFIQFALPDADTNDAGTGLTFVATVSGPGITAANNTGIWSVDGAGNLDLIVRTGDTLLGKTVTTLSYLPYSAALDGQSRTVGFNSDLIFGATFNDKSSTIFELQFPDEM